MFCRSSGIIWEQKKRKRYTSVTMLMSQMLEEGFQRYLIDLELARGQRVNGLRVLSDGEVEVLGHYFHLQYFCHLFTILSSESS